MWRRLLNSTVLTTATYRKSEKVSDGTNTQVVAQMINKCKIKIKENELYNVRDPPWIGDRKKGEESNVASKIVFVTISN